MTILSCKNSCWKFSRRYQEDPRGFQDQHMRASEFLSFHASEPPGLREPADRCLGGIREAQTISTSMFKYDLILLLTSSLPWSFPSHFTALFTSLFTSFFSSSKCRLNKRSPKHWWCNKNVFEDAFSQWVRSLELLFTLCCNATLVSTPIPYTRWYKQHHTECFIQWSTRSCEKFYAQRTMLYPDSAEHDTTRNAANNASGAT